ncbi:Protein of unknown function [Bacillus thuringiensis]|uniref:Uncharacterized protein n=1 Tax=Bacillus thuringiensis TaxID=1428 RepID=A0A1C3ZZJ3_BACTU|nr:Protein of unknown function [Bacillus thuringiensis]
MKIHNYFLLFGLLYITA